MNPGFYEVSDLNKTLKCTLPDVVKVSSTIDDIRIKCNLKNNQTLILLKNVLFYSFLGFIQSHSYTLDDMDGFYQLIAGSYKSNRPNNISGVDRTHLKCDFINGSFVNGTRENNLYSFVLDQPPGQKCTRYQKLNFLKE